MLFTRTSGRERSVARRLTGFVGLGGRDRVHRNALFLPHAHEPSGGHERGIDHGKKQSKSVRLGIVISLGGTGAAAPFSSPMWRTYGSFGGRRRCYEI